MQCSVHAYRRSYIFYWQEWSCGKSDKRLRRTPDQGKRRRTCWKLASDRVCIHYLCSLLFCVILYLLKILFISRISLWDTEKERLVLLSTKALYSVKYDFISLKILDFNRVPISLLDTIVSGELIYPSSSLAPWVIMLRVICVWKYLYCQNINLGDK